MELIMLVLLDLQVHLINIKKESVEPLEITMKRNLETNLTDRN